MNEINRLLFFLSIATSILYIGFKIFEQLVYKGIIKFQYFGILGFELRQYISLINIFYCAIGIILFIIFIIKNKISLSKKYLLLIPSIIISIYLIYIMINIMIQYGNSEGMGILILFFAIGTPLFLFYHINQNYKLIFLIILCILFPVNVSLSLFEIWGLMGI